MGVYVVLVIALIVGKCLGWFDFSGWWVAFLVFVMPLMLFGLAVAGEVLLGLIGAVIFWVAGPY